MEKLTFVIPRENNNMFKLFNIPPYGPLLLTTVLHKKGYNIVMKDEQNINIKMTDLKQTDVLLISATTANVDKAYELIKEFKKYYDRPVIMGGIHASALPQETIDNGADIVITGEAELTLPDVLLNLNKILTLPKKERIIQGKTVTDLDALPFINLNLIEKFNKTYSLKNNNITVVPVMPFRGCTNRCKFCSTWKIGGLRSRSPENVLKEIAALLNEGYDLFFFGSDYFSWNKNKSREILEGLIRLDFKARSRWLMTQDSVRMAFTADGKIDHEYLALLKAAGVGQIGLGVESLQENTFSDLVGKTGKKQCATQSMEALKAIKAHGIAPYSFLMAGADNQTPKDILDNAKIAKQFGLGQIPILTPFPGTELYDEMKKMDKIIIDGPGKWKYYDAMNVVFKHDTLSAHELKKATVKAWKTFFSYKAALLFFIKAIGHLLILKPQKFLDDAYAIFLNIMQLRIIRQVNKRGIQK